MSAPETSDPAIPPADPPTGAADRSGADTGGSTAVSGTTAGDAARAELLEEAESQLRLWLEWGEPPDDVTAGAAVQVMAELARLREQREAVLAELETWRNGKHDLVGSHLAMIKIAVALGVTA